MQENTKQIIKLACLAIWLVIAAAASSCAHKGYDPRAGYDQFIHGR